VIRWRLQPTFVALALLAGAAESFAAGEPEPEPAPRPMPLIVPAIVAYRWTFVEPVWTIEPLTVDVRAVDPATRRTRIDYDIVEFTTEHRRIGRVPEFECKYADFFVPNQCQVTWRIVYADVPIPVLRGDHMDVDVPDWRLRDARTTLDWPRLEWRRRELVVSLPATAVYASDAPVVPIPTRKEMP